MTILVHLVGPQGSGKSTLIQQIVAAAPDRIGWCEWEGAQLLSNADIRSTALFVGVTVVFVEALELEARHRDLAPGDAVLLMSAPRVPADEPQEAA